MAGRYPPSGFTRDSLIAHMTAALDARLDDEDVKSSLSSEERSTSRARWIQEFHEHETLDQTVHQGSSNYYEYLFRNLPLMDITSLSFHQLVGTAVWAFHVRGLYQWAQAVDEQIYLQHVVPHAVADEPRGASNWRYDFQWLLEREVIASLDYGGKSMPRIVELVAAEVNRKLWTLYKGGPIVFSPDLAPDILAPADVIANKKASCTGLSLMLIYALRSIGIPARLAGVYSWHDEHAPDASVASVVTQRLLQGAQAKQEEKQGEDEGEGNEGKGGKKALNNHSWVEFHNGENWRFVGAHEQHDGEPSYNQAWFFPSKTSLQIPNDPIYSIYASSYSRLTSSFPLAWNERYHGVYAEDVTEEYLKGKP